MGILNVTTLAMEGSAGGEASSLGNSTSAASNLVFNGGMLQYSGATAATTDRSFTLNNGAIGGFDSTGTAVLDDLGQHDRHGRQRQPDVHPHRRGRRRCERRHPQRHDQQRQRRLRHLPDQAGAGNWVLNNAGADSFSGLTNINGGILQIGNADTQGSLGSTSGVLDNGTLAFSRTDVVHERLSLQHRHQRRRTA